LLDGIDRGNVCCYPKLDAADNKIQARNRKHKEHVNGVSTQQILDWHNETDFTVDFVLLPVRIFKKDLSLMWAELA
jgi:hypothetical protein